MDIMICDGCGKDLTGSMRDDGFYRDRYVTLVTNKCESPHNNNEKDKPDQHFCGEWCIRDFYSNVVFTTSG